MDQFLGRRLPPGLGGHEETYSPYLRWQKHERSTNQGYLEMSSLVKCLFGLESSQIGSELK